MATAHGCSAVCPGYSAGSISESDTEFFAQLTLAGPPCNAYGTDIENLTLNVRFDTMNRLHVHIQDFANQQYQIPESVIVLDRGSGADKKTSSLNFDCTHSSTGGFGFKVSRGAQVLFDTTGHPLIFEDQYIEVTSSLPINANIYGIGETPDHFRRDPNNTTKTLWNRDAADPFRQNVYGSHSVYMELRDDQFHGVYLHNSHGMDIALSSGMIQYRTLGGTADLYFFGGSTALDVIDQYTELVGRPNRIPY
ncbi:hypothetical protein GGI02_005434, partial [Coemansia sp. RSA 2322]